MERLPSAEARAWGRKKAAERPRWTADKWHRISAILGVEIIGDLDEGSMAGPDDEVAA